MGDIRIRIGKLRHHHGNKIERSGCLLDRRKEIVAQSVSKKTHLCLKRHLDLVVARKRTGFLRKIGYLVVARILDAVNRIRQQQRRTGTGSKDAPFGLPEKGKQTDSNGSED